MKEEMENMRTEMCFSIKEDLFLMIIKEIQFDSSRERALKEVIEQARGVIQKEKEVKNLTMKQNEIKVKCIQKLIPLLYMDQSHKVMVELQKFIFKKRREKILTL